MSPSPGTPPCPPRASSGSAWAPPSPPTRSSSATAPDPRSSSRRGLKISSPSETRPAPTSSTSRSRNPPACTRRWWRFANAFGCSPTTKTPTLSSRAARTFASGSPGRRFWWNARWTWKRSDLVCARYWTREFDPSPWCCSTRTPSASTRTPSARSPRSWVSSRSLCRRRSCRWRARCLADTRRAWTRTSRRASESTFARSSPGSTTV